VNKQEPSEKPLGKIIEDTSPCQIPAKKIYAGEFVTLRPVEPERDVDVLFLYSYGSDGKERI
jgi:hypothetical protein